MGKYNFKNRNSTYERKSSKKQKQDLD